MYTYAAAAKQYFSRRQSVLLISPVRPPVCPVSQSRIVCIGAEVNKPTGIGCARETGGTYTGEVL